MSKEKNTEKVERKPKTFVDPMGRVWQPKLETLIVISACRAMDITVQKIMNMSLNIGDMLDLLWWACKEQAMERQLSYEDFMTMAVPLAKLPEAITAMAELIEASFPGAADAVKVMGGSAFKQQGPLENGR